MLTVFVGACLVFCVMLFRAFCLSQGELRRCEERAKEQQKIMRAAVADVRALRESLAKMSRDVSRETKGGGTDVER